MNWHQLTSSGIVAYIANAGYYCRDCAVNLYGESAVDDETPIDDRGNTVGALFSWEEGPLDEDNDNAPENCVRRSAISCGECGSLLRESGEWFE